MSDDSGCGGGGEGVFGGTNDKIKREHSPFLHHYLYSVFYYELLKFFFSFFF